MTISLYFEKEITKYGKIVHVIFFILKNYFDKFFLETKRTIKFALPARIK